jgi:hypothetical protein
VKQIPNSTSTERECDQNRILKLPRKSKQHLMALHFRRQHRSRTGVPCCTSNSDSALFRNKARQLDKEALIEIERHRSIQDSRKFYKRLNDVRRPRPFEPQLAMCRANNEELLTNKNQVLARWKEHFEEHLSEGSELEQQIQSI